MCFIRSWLAVITRRQSRSQQSLSQSASGMHPSAQPPSTNMFNGVGTVHINGGNFITLVMGKFTYCSSKSSRPIGPLSNSAIHWTTQSDSWRCKHDCSWDSNRRPWRGELRRLCLFVSCSSTIHIISLTFAQDSLTLGAAYYPTQTLYSSFECNKLWTFSTLVRHVRGGRHQRRFWIQ